MASFALISEGLTDQIVLERMIEQVCGAAFEGDIFVHPLQPLRDETDSVAAPHGGWELALEYCKYGVADALSSNDYVVVHLDTDEGDHPRYGLPLTDGGVSRSYDVLVPGARDIIISCIGKDLYEKFSGRIIFAISVHSMESWLLLCIFEVDEPVGSYDRINRLLARKNKPPLQKSRQAYSRIAGAIKRKSLIKAAGGNNSLALFISRLMALSPL